MAELEPDLREVGLAIVEKVDNLDDHVRSATRRRTLLIATVLVLAAVYALFLASLRGLEGDAATERRILIECTTPGPKPPPVTGHDCYDAGVRRTAEAVGQIVDADANGKPDIVELREQLGLPVTTTTTAGR